MHWLALWIAVTCIGALGVVASANSLRFGRRVSREVRDMWAGHSEAGPIDRRHLEDLPAPVRRYLEKAIVDRAVSARMIRLRHGGTFRTKLDGGWLPIQGEQYFTADPPGFVWWGRVRVLPGLWVDARDRCVDGVGNMHVMAESTVTLADSSGAEIDQGSLLRLLAEMVWFPTAYLDDRYVTWSAIDEERARATLRVAGREVTCTFVFGADDLPATVLADRYRDVDGRGVLTPWSGECSDYRETGGMLVPHVMVPYWHMDGQRIPYARFEVQQIEYDAKAPF
jgi:hypothetical protein